MKKTYIDLFKAANLEIIFQPDGVYISYEGDAPINISYNEFRSMEELVKKHIIPNMKATEYFKRIKTGEVRWNR